jgi:hypothetical protein
MIRRSKRPTARLIVHQSTLYYHPPDSSILKSVGQGLFARSIFEPDDIIVYYRGDVIPVNEYRNREREGRGGYCVQITNDTVLDCYNCWLRGECLASFANSNSNAFVKDKSVFGPAPPCNAQIVVNRTNRTVYLRAIKNIAMNEEILVPYGKAYVYPL